MNINYLPQGNSVAGLASSPYIPLTFGDYSMTGGSPILGRAPNVSAPRSFLDGMLSSTDANGVTTQGWGGMALGTAQGLFDAWMGMKKYGLAKSQLAESKRQFGLNYNAQRQTINTQLEDRQRARVASNPGAYQSVGDYMDKNSIKGAKP